MQRKHLTRSTSDNRNGTAAVEFAITLPIFLLLALATCDLGRVSHHSQIVALAARSGAQNGASHTVTAFTRPQWNDQVEQAVVDALEGIPNFDPALMHLEVTNITETNLQQKTILDLSYPFRTSIDWPGIPHIIDIHEHVEFRQYR